MEHDVYVTIRGLHQLQAEGEEAENVEMVSAGHYRKVRGVHRVAYEERMEEGADVSKVMLSIEDESLTVTHTGAIGSQMKFDIGKRNTMIYQTPFGVLEMGITTHALRMDLQEHLWKIDIAYSMDIGGHASGEHEIHLTVRDRHSESKIHLIR